jgi:predicted RNase H-like nuclease
MEAARVVGVDACRGGWVGVALGPGSQVRAYVGTTVAELVEAAERDHAPLDVVGVDIPIGLPDAGVRAADVLARAAIGPLRSSVFMTPVRDALTAPDHPTAVKVNRELAGVGVSIQAYGLRHRILEVEAWAAATRHTVLEVHPEVCFATMAGRPLTTRKSTWAGVEERRDLLSSAGIDLQGLHGDTGSAGVDDVLDAAAVAWTARRHASGGASCLPDPPERFGDGIACAIWA